MEIKSLRLPGSYIINLSPQGDERGYFMRIYDEAIFREYGLVTSWVQENQSLSTRKGLIRGLHFQTPPYAETKLVRVAGGVIWDVFVDLRKESETYGQWEAIELSAVKQNMVHIPKGFAHGFCTLSQEAIVVYKVDAPYAPDYEGGIRWDDETLKINWPTPEPFLSDKDRLLPKFRDFVSPF